MRLRRGSHAAAAALVIVMAGETILNPTPVRAATIPFGLIATPFQFVLNENERLRLVWITDDPTLVLTLAGRILTPTGAIDQFVFTAASGLLTLATQDFYVGAGSLLTVSVTVTTQNGFSLWGRNWVQVQVIQGTGAGATVLGTLVQSYATTFQPAAWPGTPFRSAVDGPGMPVALLGVAPGAGAGASVPSPFPGLRVQYVTIVIVLTTAAAAANRRVFLDWATAVGTIGQYHSPVVQPANMGWRYTFSARLPDVDNSVDGRVQIGIPADLYDLYLGAVVTPSISAINLQGGDQFSAALVTGLRWLEPGI